jgi:hypothetical protein
LKQLTILLTALAFLISTDAHAQGWKKFKQGLEEAVGLDVTELTDEEVSGGLKEALLQGITKGVETVSQPDGYFKDELIMILMPDEAEKVESTLRKIGLGSQVDDAIESMNRAAEDAASGALDIFVGAIRKMTFQDAMSLLRGEEDAATQYLDRTTRDDLTEKFQPVISTSLDKVNATRYWETVFESYNKVPFVKPVDTDLEAYVTGKAIDGLFVQVAKQEKEIRQNPGARTTDLLRKVFAD